MNSSLCQCPRCNKLYKTGPGGEEFSVLENELVALTLAYGSLKKASCFDCLDDILRDLTGGHWNGTGTVFVDYPEMV